MYSSLCTWLLRSVLQLVGSSPMFSDNIYNYLEINHSGSTYVMEVGQCCKLCSFPEESWQFNIYQQTSTVVKILKHTNKNQNKTKWLDLTQNSNNKTHFFDHVTLLGKTVNNTPKPITSNPKSSTWHFYLFSLNLKGYSILPHSTNTYRSSCEVSKKFIHN